MYLHSYTVYYETPEEVLHWDTLAKSPSDASDAFWYEMAEDHPEIRESYIVDNGIVWEEE